MRSRRTTFSQVEAWRDGSSVRMDSRFKSPLGRFAPWHSTHDFPIPRSQGGSSEPGGKEGRAAKSKDVKGLGDLTGKAASALDKAAKNGTIHWKAAARKKSRLAAQVNKLTAAAK